MAFNSKRCLRFVPTLSKILEPVFTLRFRLRGKASSLFLDEGYDRNGRELLKRFQVKAHSLADVFHRLVNCSALGATALQFRTKGVVPVFVLFNNGGNFIGFH